MNLNKKEKEYLIGIDEAGRGPLAGPVAIGTSVIDKTNSRKIFSTLKKYGLNDSKKVKEADRENLYNILIQMKKDKVLDFEVSLVSAQIISKKGISYAINFGIQKGLEKLLARHSREGGNPEIKTPNPCLRGNDDSFEKCITLELDGALKIPQGNWKKASVLIKGDSIKPSIMIASIAAKVTRDRYMKRISKKYPEYNFEIHKGYGTKKHRDLIKRYELSPEHRVGWCNN